MSKLKITLKSDLCPASGDGFSSLIDTDVSYDGYGFPFIGGRRLKGCLREAAELIGSSLTDRIFGVRGSAAPGSLRISDAKLENIGELSDEAEADSRLDKEDRKLDAEKILSLFTYTRASTAIEDDTAKEDSLRFTRVVKHYSPFDGRELVFYADVKINKEFEAEFSEICRALRNIGYKRNRGYGAVSCEFISEKKETSSPPAEIAGDELEISYIVKLEANVMISGKSSDETIDFIPGTSVLGLLAGEYLKENDADSRFEDIFLKSNVRFSNLYISDAQGSDYFPAPVIIGKVKGESAYYNILDYDRGKDNRIIKPLKSGYCDRDLNVVSPVTETVYHHTNKDGSALYTQTSLCAGQYFKGTITGKAEYVRTVYGLLCNCDICFGKSKSAQYSGCSLVNADIRKAETEMIGLKKDERFIALAASDLLIQNDHGGYDISEEGLRKALGYADSELDEGSEMKRSALKYRTIAGFSTKWNLQKPSVRAIAAGSTFVFKAGSGDSIPAVKYIGSRQNEGFGKVLFIPVSSLKGTSSGKSNDSLSANSGQGILANNIKRSEEIEQMRRNAIAFVEKNSILFSEDKMSKSQVGRFMLFVRHSNDFGDLIKLLKSDMTDKKGDGNKEHRSKAVAAFEQIVNKSDAQKYQDDHWADYLTLILTLI